ncbi:leucine-rich repeat domain-containing protein [Dyadobacter sp. 3J3]|uniref:leucine-rich repeat domain-containing protein n=1 Tax=Dyadobacter sp. 3J3 TaxID=2606600 RepID=UPI001356FA3A|nr:leucine-rich repeat domain-containing protein [Dyadobacter sp. 3J3]
MTLKSVFMKSMVILLFVSFFHDSFSQPIVLPLEKSLDLTISKTGDERQYVPISENVKIFEQVRLRYGKKIELSGPQTDYLRKMLIQSVKNVLDLKFSPDFMVNSKVCFNEKGEISYVFFDIKPFFFKNTDQVLQEKLPAELDRKKLKLEHVSSCIIPVSFYIRVETKNPGRNISLRDSSVTSLEDLMNVKDSLKIKRINLSGLDLKFIPNQIYRFRNLEELDLQGNEISVFELQMHRLPKLFKIDLSSNQLDQKNISIDKNKSLRILNLQKNAISDIPLSVRHCKRLESLWLGGNILALKTKSFRGLRHLEDLNLYNNSLAVLPEGLKKLRHLKVIDLYYNEFKEMPLVLTKLKRLETLAIAHNRLKFIDPKFVKLNKLTTFYAHHNELTSLPMDMEEMKNLRKLDLGYNNLEILPAFIYELPDLEELDISFNQLAAFPDRIVDNKKLKSVFFNGNAFLKQNPESSYIMWMNKMKLNKTMVYY